VLELNDVHARYGAITALRGVSLTVSQGELVALLGVNGAGKSTTLGSIAGVLRPSQGRISFEGASILGKSPEQIARLGISLVPEGRDIFPSLTVEENLRLGAFTHREKSEYRRNLDEVHDLFPVLKERLQQPGGTLSGGEQQQLAIARVLLARPKLLLMDEPTEGIQPNVILQIEGAIQRIKERGIAVLLVEQYLEFAWRLAGSYAIMRKGAIVSSGATADLRHDAVRQHLTV